MQLLPTDSPRLVEDIADRHRYANLAMLFGYRDISYTEIACAGWYRFRSGVFWLLNTAPKTVEAHISSLGIPDKEFFTRELESAIITEAKALGCSKVIADNVDRRMAHRLIRMGWEQRGEEFWRMVDE